MTRENGSIYVSVTFFKAVFFIFYKKVGELVWPIQNVGERVFEH